MLDVNFNEDACMVKKDNAPEILSHPPCHHQHTQPGYNATFVHQKISKRQKRKLAKGGESIMRDILGLQPLRWASARPLSTAPIFVLVLTGNSRP